jgi:hypothetical protein
MSPFDVPPDEMGIDPNIADEELDTLLSGRPASPDLARFVDDLRATFPADAPARDVHLAAMFETARLSADNGDPVVRPASNADAPVAQVSRLPKRRETRMKERKLRILVLRVAAPIVALFTVLGIMGSAGALPRGLQRMTSHAAGLVGFELPSGDDDQGDATNEDDQGDNLDDQGKDESTLTDENDQGDDSQGDSTSTDTTNQDDQGDTTTTDPTTTDPSEGDQGENDNSQGDSTDTTNQDDQGDNSQGDTTDTTNQDDQGDNSQGDTTTSSNLDDQGDGSSSGDNNQN